MRTMVCAEIAKRMHACWLVKCTGGSQGQFSVGERVCAVSSLPTADTWPSLATLPPPLQHTQQLATATVVCLAFGLALTCGVAAAPGTFRGNVAAGPLDDDVTFPLTLFSVSGTQCWQLTASSPSDCWASFWAAHSYQYKVAG
jgi:hypothetical protein